MIDNSFMSGNVPKYVLIANELRDEISRGAMRPDEQLGRAQSPVAGETPVLLQAAMRGKVLKQVMP